MSGQLWLSPTCADALADRGLATLEAWMGVRGHAALNKRGLASWRERIMIEKSGAVPRLFLKRYTRPPLREQLRRLWTRQRSIAAIEWHWMGVLEDLGIAVPRAVACGCARGWAFERHSVLVTAEIPGTSLEKWIAEHAGGVDVAVKQAIMRPLARLVARLHGAGLVHRDLYLSHIFMAPDATDPTLTLIDLQRVFRPRWRFRRWRCKDLAALNYSVPAHAASRTDRLRWFKSYVGRKRLDSADRILLGQIVRKTARIARHSSKHGLG